MRSGMHARPRRLAADAPARATLVPITSARPVLARAALALAVLLAGGPLAAQQRMFGLIGEPQPLEATLPARLPPFAAALPSAVATGSPHPVTIHPHTPTATPAPPGPYLLAPPHSGTPPSPHSRAPRPPVGGSVRVRSYLSVPQILEDLGKTPRVTLVSRC